MAQIIKHRRGSISALKDVTANIGELVMGTGSIGDLNAPVLFIGDTAVAGGYKPVSKIYQGTTAPTISVGSHGSTMDGIPFYSTGTKTLYILDKSGNSAINLTGNIEGNTISGVTINNLTGRTINLSNSGTTALSIIGDIVQTGSFYTSGDIVLRGNINIGDNLTGDTVTLNSEISSSMIPDSNNNFDLGSSSKFWRNLYVSGTAFVDTLQARAVSFTDLGISGNLSVTGSEYINQNLFVGGNTKVTGSFEAVGATNLDSTLTVSGSSTFKNNVNVSGDTSTTGSAYVNTNLFVGGNAKVTGSFEAVGATNLDSTLSVTGSATFKNNVNISGDTSTTGSSYINQNLFVGGNGKVTGSLEVVGVTNLDSTLTVTGSATFKNDANVIGVLTVTGETRLQSNLYVSGNLEVLGTSTNVNIQSNTVNIDDNIIRLNAYSPFQRYAGFEVIDSGSSGISASMVWDSQNDYWMFVSGSGQTSKFIGTTYGSYGSEVSLTTNTIPKATAANTVGNSLLTDDATTLSYNTNKFQVTASNGATLIAGNVTVSAAGGADAGTKTSAVVFRNSSNVLGYVSTTESTDVLDGILGYKNSDGALKFSTVIDGGTY